MEAAGGGQERVEHGPGSRKHNGSYVGIEGREKSKVFTEDHS